MLENQLANEITLEDQIEMIQRGDEQLKNDIIKAYQPFIAKCVSEVCKRYIEQSSDDEFSIGMIAFHDAMNMYSREKGTSFLAFSQVIIKRKVIDYIRKEKRQYIVPSLENMEETEFNQTPQEIKEATRIHQLKMDAWNRQQEILELTRQLKAYKITFQELTLISPKHQDARESAMFAANILAKNEALREYVLTKKRVPIKKLLKEVPVSKKTLERNRKYILTIFIILTGDFVYLREYLEGVDP
ncbi:RNA polymerase sigma-I factor [Gracilibacillus dipsosauri]|uniref:RNA polymerase sigma-I factor n=1 Tax=Gracilibacillus dipsosauri TaxID=178340 RepID=UPI00240A0C0B